MSDYMSLPSYYTNNQYSRLSLVLSSVLGPISPTFSESSLSSFVNAFPEHEPWSLETHDAWYHLDNTFDSTLDNVIDTPTQSHEFRPSSKPLNVHAMEYTMIGVQTPEIVEDNQICYEGRDILDLASNIVPYSWQQKTPLMEQDDRRSGKITNLKSYEEEIRRDYPMKYCANCGFSQPPAPANPVISNKNNNAK